MDESRRWESVCQRECTFPCEVDRLRRVWWSACEYDASNVLGICQKMKPLGGGKRFQSYGNQQKMVCRAFDSDVLRRVFVEVPIRRGADQMFSAFRCNNLNVIFAMQLFLGFLFGVLKSRHAATSKVFRFGRTRVVRGGAPCERRRVSCTGELHWRCPSASPLGPRGGIRSPPAGRASGAAAERGRRHLRRRRRRRRRRPPRRTRPRRLLGR